MHGIPQPNPRELLLPLLACLPTAFISPRPPPSFLPLLSPILRQRVHLRTSSAPSSSLQQQLNWLTLLSWSPAQADRLVEVVSGFNLEPHPVSGELELFGDEDDGEGKVAYRRLDEETLQARCDVKEHGVAAVWTWCENDTGAVGMDSLTANGEVASGWRVAEVLPLDEDEDEAQDSGDWRSTISEADSAFASKMREMNTSFVVPQSNGQQQSTDAQPDEEEEEEDDYWASYDRTPARTPAHRSPAPPSTQNSTNQQYSSTSPALSRDRQASTSAEDEYYARYGEVQPAMDAHDPDEEEIAGQFESTLGAHHASYNNGDDDAPPGFEAPAYDHNTDITNGTAEKAFYPARIHSPIPSRPSSSQNSRSGSPNLPNIHALEASATSSSAAEVGVKQHISTELKSLYRLAKAAGIERDEFERCIRVELDVLGMMDG